MSNVFDKSWEPAVSVTVSLFVSVSVSVDPCDMLNNFCFHFYAQKSLFIGEDDNAFFTASPTTPVQ